jgi:Tol biopolymer transport system component
VVTDINNDGYLDVFQANDTVANFLFVNRGGKRVQEIGLASGVGYSEDGVARSGMGVDAADFAIVSKAVQLTGPPHNIRKLLDLAIQIADGLAAAHAAGIIHRDLKPENVLVTRENRVKILDFGLAKHSATALADEGATQAAGATNPGMVMGTVSYMSPEQARGLPVDARSDQFSFGVMLYELANGNRPFKRETAAQTMAAIIEADPEPLPTAVPAPLRWIVERCLSKEPSARYESTRDLYRDLRSLQDHISEVLSSGSAPALEAKQPTRKWMWPTAAAAGIVLAVLTGAVGYWMGTRRSGGTESLVPVPITTSGGTVQNPSFSPDASQIVFAWNGPRQENFNLYVRLIGSNDLLRLTNDSANEGSPAWSPDGKRIAFVRDLGKGKCSVMMTSPLGGSERKLTDISCADASPAGHSLLAWTPDGRYLAVPDVRAGDTSGPKFDLISIDTAERRTLTRKATGQGPGNGDLDPAFSLTGDRFAFVRVGVEANESHALWMRLGIAYEPIGPVSQVHTSALINFSPAWTNDGQLLVSAGQNRSMRLYKIALSSSSRAKAMPGILTSGGMALNAKTGRLIYPSAQLFENLYRIPLDTVGRVSSPPERLTSTTGSDFMPRYSPDGKSIAFTSARFGEFGIWTVAATNSAATALTTSLDATLVVGAWATDGKSLVYFRTTTPDGLWQLYRIAADTGHITRVTDDKADDFLPNYSRDGNWIYFSSSRSGKVELYKMRAGGGPAILIVPRSVANAQESPDGGWLYFADWGSGDSLWRMPTGGGEITRVAERIGDGTGWAPTNEGVYYWAPGTLRPELRFINLQSHENRLVFQPTTPINPSLTISPDGRYLCFPEVERNSQELMMVENFH